MPRALDQRLLEFLQLTLRRSDDVPRAALAEPLQVLFAHHPAVDRPDAILPAILRLHPFDDLAQCSAVVTIAGEDLVAQRKPVARHDQADADLQAIRPVIA